MTIKELLKDKFHRQQIESIKDFSIDERRSLTPMTHYEILTIFRKIRDNNQFFTLEKLHKEFKKELQYYYGGNLNGKHELL